MDAIVSGRSRIEGLKAGSTKSQSGRDALTNFVALTNATTMTPEEITTYLGERDMTLARVLETESHIGILFASKKGLQLVSEKIPAKDIAGFKKNIDRLM